MDSPIPSPNPSTSQCDSQLSSPSGRDKATSHDVSEPSEQYEREAQSPGIVKEPQIVTPTSSRYTPYGFRGYTSEIFKLEVLNLPAYVGFKQLKNRLQGLKLNPVKIKMNRSLCFVTFKNEEERQQAMEVINGHVWKKKTLRAILAKPAMDPVLKRKRQASSTNEDKESKRICEDSSASSVTIDERLAEAITPLLKLSYDEQLSLKSKRMKEFLVNAAQSVKRLKPGEWFSDHVSSSDDLLCPLEPIKPSPVLSEYRNKCEFTIGLGSTYNTVVGFRLGAYRDGDLTVAPPNSCIVPPKTKKLIEVVQKVVGESTLKPFDCFTLDGHWKQVLVREFTTGETMMIVQLHPQQLSEDIISKEKQLLVAAFNREPNDNIPTSLYWQTLQERTAGKEKVKYELLMGSEYIHEDIMGVRFRVSPDAFFQINSKATEVLYSTIGDQVMSASEEDVPLIYDLCCGTGTIGITMSKIYGKSSRIVGIEMVEQAITDAKHNASANGLKNADFICGKVENVLPSLIAKERSSAAIAIADPPRVGLHLKVIQAIRKCSAIKTLIYVSCNPEGALNNFVDLCRPESRRIKGPPFCPVNAIPIDMFPHTKHCELVVVFKRIEENNAIDSKCAVDSKETVFKSESDNIPVN